jgi:lipopolysaccharide biosynthesis glycosyltransferase
MLISSSKEMNIVCTIDDNYARHCAAMLCSLSKNNPETIFNIFIIISKLREDIYSNLLEFLQSLGFNVHFIPIDESRIINAPIHYHVSLATYFRLFIPELLDSAIEKVLFLDSDIVIRDDITPFWNTNVSGYSHAAVENPGFNREYKEKLGISVDGSYFNAGVMLINLEYWRQENLTERGIDFINRNPDKIDFCDQDVLNYLLQFHWLKVDSHWNAQEGFFRGYSSDELGITDQKHREIKESPSIVHFTGSGSCKPWHYQCEHPFKGDYYRYLAQTPWRKSKPIGKPSLVHRVKQKVKALVKSI